MKFFFSTIKTILEGADFEARTILHFIRLNSNHAQSILDIGCGRGRNLKFLLDAGYKALGVELNPAIVLENKKNGLPCVTPQELDGKDKFDVLLMSHIIEHFSPEDLKNFFQTYLSKLKPGGLLVIATPLMSSYFFDDFDHIRPYHPESLLLLMGSGGQSQMQYHSSHSLKLLDLWYRRSPVQLSFCRGRHVPGWSRTYFSVVNLFFLIIYRCTFRLLARKDGWVGAFRLEK